MILNRRKIQNELLHTSIKYSNSKYSPRIFSSGVDVVPVNDFKQT